MIAITLIMVRLICQAGVSLSDDRIFNSRERNVACCLCLIMLTENFVAYILVKVKLIWSKYRSLTKLKDG